MTRLGYSSRDARDIQGMRCELVADIHGYVRKWYPARYLH